MGAGFDIQTQAEAAKKEDSGTVVHIHGIDETPLYYESDGKLMPVTITVAGAHSSLFRRAEAQQRKRKIKSAQLTSERIYTDNIEKVVACTLEWDGFFSGGDVVKLTPHNARELYKACPWVLEQVLEAMNDHSRFFENGSKPPQNTSDSSDD